jgi:hypothetical protein
MNTVVAGIDGFVASALGSSAAVKIYLGISGTAVATF